MDQAEILTIILRRNALRRDARLPPLDVGAEFRRAVEHAYWREVRKRHCETVRAEVVEHLRSTRGRDYRESTGGRWLIEAMVARELEVISGACAPPKLVGYAAVDAALAGLGDNGSR